MPLRFRSVVPYTLPGVLALIGWWWYVSRKKEQLISCDTKDGTPTPVGLRASPAEGSNSVDKDTASSKNKSDVPLHRPSKVVNRSIEDEIIFNIKVQNTEAAPSLEQSSDEASPDFGRIREEEVHKSSGLSADREEDMRELVSEQKRAETSSPLALVLGMEKHLVKDPPSAVIEVILPCRSTEFTWSTPTTTTTSLSEAERPDPEGEVAKHHDVLTLQDEMVVLAATPQKTQREGPSAHLETPSSAQDSHQHLLTSTPAALAQTSPLLTIAASVSPEDFQVRSSSGEQQDLELLAAGLITEVISAATQEVLGVTSCPIADANHPSCCRLCSQQEPVTPQHHGLVKTSQMGQDSREAPQKDHRMLNGCSSAPGWDSVEDSRRVHQKDGAQRGRRPPASQHTQPRAEDVLAEDSACSTYHSEDCNSSEDFQSNTSDAAEATDSGAAQRPRPQRESVAEDDSMDAVCEAKRFNGIDLGHGTGEAEADQSGGSDVNSMDSLDSGCTMGLGESHTSSSSCEPVVWDVELPKRLVGRLIGKRGRYVSFLKQTSGAKIYISTLPYTQDFQICHIEGTQQQIDKALSLIGKKFKELDLTNVYASSPLTLPSLPMTSWLLLPSGVTVEVIVVNIVSAGHIFVQQHTHPTYHALRSLDQQMFLCYSQAGTPALPSPAEVGVICAAPALEGAWWRAQVITFYKETSEVEIRYVDYGGYDRVKIDLLRQIRSDFVTLPFQGAEVLLDNVAPLPGEDCFSAEATSALEEMTRGVALLAQVSNYDNNTGLPLVHLWNMVGDEVVSVNRTLADRGLGTWVDGF